VLGITLNCLQNKERGMRCIQIQEDLYLEDADDCSMITCPLAIGERSSRPCRTICAWFNIQTHFKNDGEDKVAYCGDKIIGMIAE